MTGAAATAAAATTVVVPLAGAKNVQLRVAEGGAAVYLYVDLSADFGASSTGKSVVIASSCGNKPLGQSGIFLGLNVYVKSLAQRALCAAATAALRSRDDAFVPVGEHCAWRIVRRTDDDDDDDNAAATDDDDEKSEASLLCIRLDLAGAAGGGGRPAGSGKSVLLATTSGNKAVAGTGVMCGLNCYRPINARVDLGKLAQLVQDELQQQQQQQGDGTVAAMVAGTQRELGNGFVLHCRSATEAVIEYMLDADALAQAAAAAGAAAANTATDDGDNKKAEAKGDGRRRARSDGDAAAHKDTDENNNNNNNNNSGSTATIALSSSTVVLPPCRVGDVTVSLTIAAPKPKRTRTDAATAAAAEGDTRQADSATTDTGALLLQTAAEVAKVRNVAVTCAPATDATAAAPAAHVYVLRVSFDPSRNLGRSASGKSLLVASSGGFQIVAVAAPANNSNNNTTTTTRSNAETTGAVAPQRVPVCRINFNAYKPAPTITAAMVMQTAQRVLGSRSLDELNTMTLKTAMRELLSAMELSEKHEASLKEKMCNAVKAVMDDKRKSSEKAVTSTKTA